MSEHTIDRKLFLSRGLDQAVCQEHKYSPAEFFSAERKNKETRWNY